MIILLATLKVMAESMKDSASMANIAANLKGINCVGIDGKKFTSPSLKHRGKIRRDSKKFHP